MVTSARHTIVQITVIKHVLQLPTTPGSSGRRHSRRSTFELDKPSPGVKDMLDAMQTEMSSEERKHSLMAALDKKVAGRGKYMWSVLDLATNLNEVYIYTEILY